MLSVFDIFDATVYRIFGDRLIVTNGDVSQGHVREKNELPVSATRASKSFHDSNIRY